MLFLYEARVLLVLLTAKYLAYKANMAAEAHKEASLQAEEACRAPIPSNPNSYDAAKRQAKLVAAIEAQAKAEELWLKREEKSIKAEALYKKLNSRAGRQVPGLLATMQAWVCAGILSYKMPDWAAQLAALVISN